MDKPFEEMTIAELEAERAHWERVLDEATDWGAHVPVADGYRRGCIAWIAKRKLEGASA